MTDYITIGKKSNNFFYYTPINTKINFQVFKEYAESQKNKEIDEELANLMNSIEQQIVSSNAFKALENKPIINQNKWNALKVKKTALTNICIVLNKLNEHNINECINECKTNLELTYEELTQLADIYLGKCIMENKKVWIFVEYFKAMINNKCWYCKHNDEIISFRDTIFDRLENEYERLTRIAGYIEDVFKNRIKDNTTTDLDGAEDYLKKKNIILSLINIIGSFFNEKIISYSLLKYILNQLKIQYESSSSKKIYLELWIVLWEKVSKVLYLHFNSEYNDYINWLNKTKNDLIVINDNDSLRIISLIDNNLTIEKVKNDNIVSIESIFDIEDEIVNLKTQLEFENFKKLNKNLNAYITKHLLNLTETNIKVSIQNITKYFVDVNELKSIVNDIINNEDIICDYPNFEKLINKYI